MLPVLAHSANDLSTPEATINTFVEAFRIGSDSQLSKTLGPDAKLYEFNSVNKIECPTPEINTSKVKSIIEIHEEEVELLLLIESSKEPDKGECARKNLLPEKSIYVIRKLGEEWKIIQAAPFWPYNIE